MTIKTFKNKKNSELYMVGGEVNMKDPHTRKWVKAYLYTPMLIPGKPKEALMCVREQKDFHERFIQITG